MELRQLKYFLKAKELLNFTEAAKALYISQSTLSQQIKQLEVELNVPLFNRIGKHINLTEAGERFSEFAQQSVNRANDGLLLLQDMENLKTGTISIGVTYALRNLLTQTLKHFSLQYPDISVHIIFGTSDELIHKLKQFELDFVLTFNESDNEPTLNYFQLFSSPMTLVASPNAPLSKPDSISLKSISKLPLVLPSRGYSTIQFIEDAFQKSKLDLNAAIEINDIPTLLELVKTGHWYTILTRASVNDKALYTTPITGKNMTRKAMIITVKEVYVKKASGKFQELLIQTLSNQTDIAE